VTDIRFEARLARVVREYADTALLPIDAVAIAEASVVAGGRDERRWALPPLPRAWALIALAALIATILAASFFVGGRRSNEIVQPSSSTTPSPSPATAPPVSSSDAAGSGTWLADVPANLAFDGRQPARMALTVDSGPTASIELDSGTAGLFRSTVLTYGIGDIQFTTVASSGESVSIDGTAQRACAQGDEGHYRSTVSQDGLVLTLTAVTESCPSRQAVLARSWTRSISVPNGGGVGVVDGFDPVFTVVLPAGNYVVDRSTDSRTIHQDLPELQFLSFKDPQGFKDPCDLSKGRYEIAPGAQPFVAYFRQLRGFTVDSTDSVLVDGLPAVKLVVHANADASCPDGRLWEWQPKAETTGAAWFVRPGVTDSLYLVEHPSGTLMFEVLPAPNALEQRVISTIHFLDRLPTHP
jgi:hypothetical protein